jgi:hypothetical protein
MNRPSRYRHTVSEKVEGADYESLVAALQRALVRFGEAVADSVAATDMAKAPWRRLRRARVAAPCAASKRWSPLPASDSGATGVACETLSARAPASRTWLGSSVRDGLTRKKSPRDPDENRGGKW